MILAQISDLHVTPEGTLAYGKVDAAPMLRSAIAHLNRLDPSPAAVLITGDLTDGGQPEAYARLRRLLSELRLRYFVLPGNHDHRDNLRAAFQDHAYLAGCGEFLNYAIDEFPVRLVALDTLVQGRTRGDLCDSRLAWLQDTLAARPDVPTIVAMHHAPITTGLNHFDRGSMDGIEALREVIVRNPQVVRIVCGHVHRATHLLFGRTLLSACPSTAHQVNMDLRPGGQNGFTFEPAGFQLHRWAGSELFTYTLNVGDFEGPFSFH